MPSTHETPYEDPRAPSRGVVELYPPVDDGWHTSRVRDWIPVCPELGNSAVRLYLILRSLVIDKHGPVRKLTLTELCHLLPKKPVPAGQRPEPSSLSRIRGLLTTSSRALAAGQGLRMRINLMPRSTYTGPRNAFALLDEIRPDAAARSARLRELELAALRTAADRQEKKTRSQGAGQNSGPDSRADQQDRELPLSPSAQSSRSAASSVRPSPHVGEGEREGTEGRTDERAAGKGEDEHRGAGTRKPPAAPAPRTEDGERGSARRPEITPGLDVLYRLGAQVPRLALAGRPLADQARRLDDLLATTPWTSETLLAALAAPFEGTVRTSAGAVVSARITALPAAPVLAEGRGEVRRTVAEEAARRVLAECTDCGRPPLDGGDRCAECAGWPLCSSCGLYRTKDGSAVADRITFRCTLIQTGTDSCRCQTTRESLFPTQDWGVSFESCGRLSRVEPHG
ncbi:hypothetical protein [Streptomyces termitum]|uniref:hypothetical protein n=1 Tax=Streptomyces termitum TaxID=67368 RepID=UPI0033B6A886